MTKVCINVDVVSVEKLCVTEVGGNELLTNMVEMTENERKKTDVKGKRGDAFITHYLEMIQQQIRLLLLLTSLSLSTYYTRTLSSQPCPFTDKVYD